MTKKLLLIAALISAASLSAHAGVRFGFAIGLPLPAPVVVAPVAPVVVPAPIVAAPVVAAPTVVAPAPFYSAPGYVWAPGYWSVCGSGRVWVAGCYRYRGCYARPCGWRRW